MRKYRVERLRPITQDRQFPWVVWNSTGIIVHRSKTQRDAFAVAWMFARRRELSATIAKLGPR
jgi:hypothetical protein